MHDEPTPRNLPERTGKHYCIQCRREVPADEYLRNDMLCDECVEKKDDEEGLRRTE